MIVSTNREIICWLVLGNSYTVNSYSPPGGDYDDPLDCEESEINCPACLLQVKSAVLRLYVVEEKALHR